MIGDYEFVILDARGHRWIREIGLKRMIGEGLFEFVCTQGVIDARPRPDVDKARIASNR